MDENEWLADRFEEHRAHLRAVAYRMLGSLTEADDAVQDTWLRLSRSGAGEVENLGGWLTTIVARVCLNMLRSRNVRREESFEVHLPDPVISPDGELQPEEEALLADSVGLALLVVLDTLAPAERLAFVLHDMFELPFEEIAPMVGRTPAAARQLASRARRRVKGADIPAPDPDLARQRDVVDAFFLGCAWGRFRRPRRRARSRRRAAIRLGRQAPRSLHGDPWRGGRCQAGAPGAHCPAARAAPRAGERSGRSGRHRGWTALRRDGLHRRRGQDRRDRRDRRPRTRPQDRSGCPHRRVVVQPPKAIEALATRVSTARFLLLGQTRRACAAAVKSLVLSRSMNRKSGSSTGSDLFARD